MTTSRVGRLSVLLAAVLLLGVGPSHAASVSGRSSTVLEWYDTFDGDTTVPVYQYLLFNGKDLGADHLNFRGYGRLSTDLQDEVDVPSELYYAFLEKRDLLDNLGFRLGRQNIATSAGFSVVDGLLLDLRRVGPLGFRLYGGGDVKYDADYDAGNLTWGGEVVGNFLSGGLDLGLSYLQKWDDSALTMELIGADANATYRNLIDAYGEWQFDYLSNTTSYALGGFKYHQFREWSLRGEYLYSLPVFESTSIYSVFAADAYQHLLGEFTYRFDAGLLSFVRYTHEMYESFSNADVFEAGLEKIGTGRFSGYLIGILREDEDGQDLRGVKARAAYFFNSYLQLGAGAHFDVLERDPEDDAETTAKRYWADGTVFLSKKINVEAKIERIESALWNYYHRGRVRLNILF